MAAPIRIHALCCRLLKRSTQRCSGVLSYSKMKYSKSKENADERQTHFGFESVPEEEKEERVYEVFKNVASNYDLMNDAMSAGIHRLWKDIFIQRLSPTPGTQLLDVAGGTGDIAFRFLKYANSVEHVEENNEEDEEFNLTDEINAQVYGVPVEDIRSEKSSISKTVHSCKTSMATHVTVCDINQEMLNVGKHRALDMDINEGISWMKGNAECLPLGDNLFDAYTIAYGIRNCTHIDKVVEEAYRVLKPGGRFMCLEFSQVPNPLLRSLYDNYSFQVIPVMGQVLARDWKSYQYLVESIRQFPCQREFASIIRKAGFQMVKYENLTFGVTAIHSGFKL